MVWSIFPGIDFNAGHSAADTTLVSRAWRNQHLRGRTLHIIPNDGEKFREDICAVRGLGAEQREGIIGLWLQGAPERSTLDVTSLNVILEALPNVRVLVFQHVWLAKELAMSLSYPNRTLNALVLKDIIISPYSSLSNDSWWCTPDPARQSYSLWQFLVQFREIATLVVEGAAADSEAPVSASLDIEPSERGLWLARGDAPMDYPRIGRVIIQNTQCPKLFYGCLSRYCSTHVTDLRLSIQDNRELDFLCEMLPYTNSLQSLAIDISRCCQDGPWALDPQDFISFKLVGAISQHRLRPELRMLVDVSISIFVDVRKDNDDPSNSKTLRCLEGLVQGMSDSVQQLKIEFVFSSLTNRDILAYFKRQTWTTIQRLVVTRHASKLENVHFTICNRLLVEQNERPSDIEVAVALDNSFPFISSFLTFNVV